MSRPEKGCFAGGREVPGGSLSPLFAAFWVLLPPVHQSRGVGLPLKWGRSSLHGASRSGHHGSGGPCVSAWQGMEVRRIGFLQSSPAGKVSGDTWLGPPGAFPCPVIRAGGTPCILRYRPRSGAQKCSRYPFHRRSGSGSWATGKPSSSLRWWGAQKFPVRSALECPRGLATGSFPKGLRVAEMGNKKIEMK